MSLFSIRPGYAGSCRIISNTTNDAARICRSKKMRPSADSTYAKLPDRERFPSARARMQNQPCARLCPLVPLEVFAIGPLKVGGADGIRIYQRYGNKGVLRCSLAFKGIERKEREFLVPP